MVEELFSVKTRVIVYVYGRKVQRVLTISPLHSKYFLSAGEKVLECRGKLFGVRSNNFSDAMEKLLGCVPIKRLFCA